MRILTGIWIPFARSWNRSRTRIAAPCQKDYLKLIRKLGSREAITRRFFLIFEYEPLPGTKRGHEEEDAIASLQTAARTASNYLRQCGNEVISPEDEDNAAAEILYNILCRRASSEPFYQRVKSVLADYIASGRDINTIPVNEFYAPDRIDLSHGSYLCIDGLYYAYLLVPSDGYKARVPAGWSVYWSTQVTGSIWTYS